ncbi:MAG: hypothetical protein WD076_10895 [Parvularculaceae bacterium]
MTDDRPTISPDINPAVGAVMRSARDFLTREWGTNKIKPAAPLAAPRARAHIAGNMEKGRRHG